MYTDQDRADLLEVRPCQGETTDARLEHLAGELERLNRIWANPAASFAARDLMADPGAPARYKIAAGLAVDRVQVEMAEARAEVARARLEERRHRGDVARAEAEVAATWERVCAAQAELDQARAAWAVARNCHDLAVDRERRDAQEIRAAEHGARLWREQLARDADHMAGVAARSNLAGIV